MNKFIIINYSINQENCDDQFLYNFKERTDLNDKLLILCISIIPLSLAIVFLLLIF